MFKLIGLTISLSLALFIASCGTGTTAEQEADKQSAGNDTKAASYVTMPANTRIAVSLIDSIDTDIHVSGHEFAARLTHPIVVDGETIFADGADARGILSRVVESGRLKTPAEVDFSLTAIKDPSGRWVNFGTGMIQDKKGSHTNREVAMIGGGALVGGIIGKIIDRKGSTEIGAVAGAVAGTGLSAATGKQDIFYGPGTEFVFFSNHTMQISMR